MRFWYGMFFGMVLGGLFLPRWGYAQVDTTRASELRQRGDSLYHVRQRSRARELFLAARADYEKAEAWSQSLHCQTMALACIPFGQRTAEDEAAFRALIRREQELALPSAEAYTRRLLGIHFYVKQAWDSALYQLELAAELLEAQARTDSTLLGQIYQTKGYTLTQRGGSLREAEQWWRGVKAWEEAGRNDPVELSKVVLQMARIQEKWGDRGQELALREEVMALREKALGPHHQLTGNAYHSLGSLYFMLKNYPRAQAYYEKAREAFATDPQYEEKRMALLLNDLAMTSYHLGQDAEGIAYLEESRRRLNALYGEGNPETIWIYSNLALFQTRAHDSVGALQSHYRALAIGQANYPGKSEVTGFNETEIGYHFLRADRYDSALVHFQRALHHSLPGFTDSDLSVLPQLEGVISEDLLADALELKADAFWRRFQAAGDLRDLELAFANCRLLADYMLETRTGLASAEGQQFYADRTRDVLEIAVGVCYDLFQHTGEEKYAEAAFQFTEQSRSQQLMDGLQTALAREVVAIPDSLRALEDELRAQMAEAAGIVRRELSKGEAGDQAALTAARIERGKLMRKHADFTARLKTTRPRYHRARYDRRRLTFAELRATVLAVPRVLHSYFFVREDLYHLVLHPDSVEFIRHAASGEIVEQVEALCAHLRRPNFSGNWQARGREFARMGYALGRELLGPQAPGVPLIVIPDRALAYLPFEVLLAEAPAEEGFAYEDLAYLLQTHPVSYAFSAAHLRQVLAEEESATPRTCVAFAWSPPGKIATGPLAAAREATLGALPGSGEELRAIARSLEGDFYYGESASKAAFLRHAGDPGILHLALHGEGNAEDPRDNRLRFPHRDSRGEEETLFLWELYGLQLAADLVVLSACETGLGKLQDGEGVMNLARGFAYAGTKSQVMSLWQMDDQSTAQIMGGFYEALAAGRSRGDALRQAKRGYLEAATGPDAHPYYWAGAQLVGDPGELPVARATAFFGKWGLLGIGLLLVLGGGIFWGMRRRMRPSVLQIGLAVIWLGGAGCSPVDPDTIPELVSVTYRHPTWPEDKYVTLYNSRDSTFIDAPEWQSEKTDTAYGLYRIGERLELEAVFRAKKDPGSVRIWARSNGRSPAKAPTKFLRVGDEFRAKAQFKFAAPRKRQGVRIENFWLSWHTRIKGRRFAIGESNHKVYRVYDLP
ncbi:MAG: CHAT domain-containing tetratricopeptide repeat protein, partial [Bacteroidota bacterium]